MAWPNLPRNSGIIVHHTTAPSWSTQSYLAPANCSSIGYDFQVQANGDILVSPRHNAVTGCHAGGCNCRLGVGLQGCFGSTDGFCNGRGNALPTIDQKCSLAYIWAFTGGAFWDQNTLRPHRSCHPQNPCAGSPQPTACCGTNLAANNPAQNHWKDGDGVAFRSDVAGKASNWVVCGTCLC